MRILLPAIIAVIINSSEVSGQSCTTLGQNPTTAFPVCALDTFRQTTVPECGGRLLPGPCSADQVSDMNPFWYKFTCYVAGNLGFKIIPNDLNDDYDWQLFDITGRNPNEVFTSPALFVACNWSGNPGITGASAAGTSLQNCGGYAYPTFSSRPVLIQGHEYLLLLSHFTAFTPSQNGYKLVFEGGTAVITDPKIPAPEKAMAECGGRKIAIKLNKKMKCSSIAPDGSDFQIANGIGTILKAEGYGCESGFETDSVILSLANTIAPGNYSAVIQRGADGNTLLDNCAKEMTPGSSVPFTIEAIAPSLMDSIQKTGCAPGSIIVKMKDPVLCNGIAADGSDFLLTGPQGVAITGATGDCNNTDNTRTITLQLAQPIVTGGVYRLEIRSGTDGNSLLSYCGLETPAGTFLEWNAADTVNADFTYTLKYGCKEDTIQVSHPGGNGVNRWEWYAGNQLSGTGDRYTFYYQVFGSKIIKLKVSNGVCTDSVTTTVVLDNALNAAFSAPATLCPEDMATFTDQSIGKINAWAWNFGDGTSSSTKDPLPKNFPAPTNTREIVYTVRLQVTDEYNCTDTASARITVVSTCRIAVPNAFTPNMDGRNDYLYPLNAYKTSDLRFTVYNRYGQRMFETRDWTLKWDGTINGVKQPSGTYVWVLTYIDTETGQKIARKGTTVLIR